MFLTMLLIAIVCNRASASSLAHKLHDVIFSNYNPDLRPVRNSSTSINIQMSFGLHDLIALEESMEKLISNHWLTLTWKDEFLTWNKTEYGGINSITVPAKRVWVPDMYLVNSKLAKGSFFIPDDYTLSVRHDGMVRWSVNGESETHCRMNVEKFPFDTQVCSFDLSLWTSQLAEVTMTSHREDFVLCFYKNSRSWEVRGVDIAKEPLCDDSEQVIIQDILKFKLTLSRRPLFYVMSIILPVCLLSLLNPVVFLVPVDSGEKISLSISVLLSYFVVLSVLTTTLPEVSDSVSILNIYVCTMLCLKVVTVLSTAGIVRLYHRPNSIPLTGVFFVLGNLRGKKPDHVADWKDVSLSVDRIMFYTMSVLVTLVSCAGFCLLLI